MYFRGDSKRDIRISQEEEAKNYDTAICQYCSQCMDKYNLSKGKVPRRLGRCGICGNDGYITGSLYSMDEAIVLAKKEYLKPVIEAHVSHEQTTVSEFHILK